MKAFSLFSGVGGFDLALERAGIEIVGHSEIDPSADKIYKSHFSNPNFGDVSKIDTSTLPDFDILVFGSPCQDLSICNHKREGLSGARSGLFWEAVRILRAKKPTYF
jgi:Site-specific DNA methylase